MCRTDSTWYVGSAVCRIVHGRSTLSQDVVVFDRASGRSRRGGAIGAQTVYQYGDHRERDEHDETDSIRVEFVHFFHASTELGRGSVAEFEVRVDGNGFSFVLHGRGLV